MLRGRRSCAGVILLLPGRAVLHMKQVRVESSPRSWHKTGVTAEVRERYRFGEIARPDFQITEHTTD